MDYWDLLAARLDPDDFAAVTRSQDGGGDLDVSRLLGQLRTDDEIANAILINRQWTQQRLGVADRRASSNRLLAETLRTRLADRGAL